MMQFLALEHLIRRGAVEHTPRFEHIDSRDRKALIDIFEHDDVVFDVRERTEYLVIGDIPACAAEIQDGVYLRFFYLALFRKRLRWRKLFELDHGLAAPCPDRFLHRGRAALYGPLGP